MKRRVEWPEYPSGDPRSLGILVASTVNLPIISAILCLAVKMMAGGKPLPRPLIESLAAAFAINTGSAPLVAKVCSDMTRRVTVKPDGLEVRLLRRRFVRAEEVAGIEVEGGTVIVETVDGRRLRLRVLDPEGFVATVSELWGLGR